MTAYLLDTNIWFRSVQREAPHHPIAVEALATLLAQGNDVFITAQNLIEFWSVASRPIEANGLGWSVETVRQEIDRLLALFPLLDDTADVQSRRFPAVCDDYSGHTNRSPGFTPGVLKLNVRG